jgi:D-lactate dehydrogenase (cytochrome)
MEAERPMRKLTEPDALAEFETDESGIFHAEGVDAIYFPQSEAELGEALAEANAEARMATLSGAGTGITGGRVAVHGGLVIATQDLRAPHPQSLPAVTADQFGRPYTVYVDEANAEAIAPAGVSLELLAEMLPDGLLYPPDPTEKSAFLGGTIATNASGAHTFHYGATREWVLGLRVVLPTGDVLNVNRGDVTAQDGVLRFCAESGREYVVPVPTYAMPDVKNAAGLYARPDMDLVDLFIGSEGILGVVTEARLKLTDRPAEIASEIAFFESEDQALGFIADLRAAATEGTMKVLSIEYFDGNSLEFMASAAVPGTFAAAVFTEIAGTLDDIEPMLESLEAHGCAHDWFAETAEDLREQKEFRHSLPDGVNSYLRRVGSQKLGTDLAVPAEAFGDLLAAYHAAGDAFAAAFPREGKHYLMFGHIGNHHLHVNFITQSPDELAYAKNLYAGLARQAVAAGGTISAEHGVGKKTIAVDGKTMPYLEIMLGHEGLLQIARAKKALDPNLILNVGNMVPLAYLQQV